jgi:hypothetical protein
MGQADAREDLTVETEVENETESMRLVPVAESIRYRRRAQTAEKQNETLSGELAKAKSEAANMAEELKGVRTERELMGKLSAAGAVDLEAAVVLAKARLGASEEAEVDKVVEALRKEKGYLFAGLAEGSFSARKTAGAKERGSGNQTVLERSAKRAAATGRRADLQEYLKLRRSAV